MDDSSNFRTDGGATWLNLLATRGQSFGAHPVERLRSPGDLHRWLTLMGMPPADAPTPEQLDAAIRLREELRTAAMAAVDGKQPTAANMKGISEIAGGADPGVALIGKSVDVPSALAALAVQAALTLRGPDREFLTECDEVDCRWVFLDPSGRRRWCPSPACASRGRVRAHRAAKSSAR